MEKLVSKIADNVERVIRGKRDAVEAVLTGVLAGGHILLEDVPGVGKTRLAGALTKSISATFGRVQFTPDVLPSDVTGYSLFNPKTREFDFKPGAVFNEFLLADEINRTSPKTQSGLLEAMEERRVTVDGNTYNLPELFCVLATQNPIEHASTYPLPEAQLDRFLIKISIGYPSAPDETDIVLSRSPEDPLNALEPVCSTRDVLDMRERVKDIYVARPVGEYIVNLAAATRRHPGAALGVSVRGSLALAACAKARAFADGRDYVTPEDAQFWIVPAFSHRITVRRAAAGRRFGAEDVIKDALSEVKVPKNQ